MDLNRQVLGAAALLILATIIGGLSMMALDWLMASPDCSGCVSETIWLMAGCVVSLLWVVLLWLGYTLIGRGTGGANHSRDRSNQ